MKRVMLVIDSISEQTGKLARWACLAAVLVLSAEVFMRYILDRPTLWSYEVSIMLGLTIGVGGLAYAHLHDAHVRIDVVYRLFSPRWRRTLDAIGTIIFFLPIITAITWFSAYWALRSWSVQEVLTESYWYPPAWPIRVVMFLGFLLFGLQGLAELIRYWLRLKEE